MQIELVLVGILFILLLSVNMLRTGGVGFFFALGTKSVNPYLAGGRAGGVGTIFGGGCTPSACHAIPD